MEKQHCLVTDYTRCTGCNKCITVCPVDYANQAFLDENRLRKVKVNEKYCIHCGACLDVCDHGARQYLDDTEVFFQDLSAGKPISLLVAPAALVNFKQWGKLFGYLKEMGVREIFDVSFGADITTWAYLKTMEEHKKTSLISQPCPVVVTYIEKYLPDLLERLAPIQSPLLCLAIYLRKYLQRKEAFAFLSPCIAKTDEIHDGNTNQLVAYNVTFKKLEQYLEQHHINLDRFAPCEFDGEEAGIGMTFSRPGGLKENVNLYRPDLWVKQVEDPIHAYTYLQAYSKRIQSGQKVPNVVDILNCTFGCNLGTGTMRSMQIDDIDSDINQRKQLKMKVSIKKRFLKHRFQQFTHFNKKLNLEDFRRTYTKRNILKEFAENDLEDVYRQLHKNTKEAKEINCFACGYGTCKKFAQAIKAGINIPENCVDYTRRLIELEHEKISSAHEQLEGAMEKLQSTANEREEKTKVLQIHVNNIIEAIHQVSDNSEENAQSIEQIKKQVIELSTVANILRESIQSVAEKTADFSKASKDIVGIAGQTNLLALNASIEAARAGELGKGFAVVAGEVGKLAKASEDIVAATQASQEDVAREIKNILAVSNTVEEKVDVVNTQVKNISGTIEDVNAKCEEIAAAANTITRGE